MLNQVLHNSTGNVKMNTDIRLNLEFFSHPKIVKLERRLGVIAVKGLLQLWLWVARNRPNGALDNMDVEDIEIAAGWSGDSGAFVAALESLRLLDSCNNCYAIHNWERHNGWAARSSEREDKARFSRLWQVAPDAAKTLRDQGVTAVTREEYEHYVRGASGDSPAVARRSPANSQRNASLQPAPSPSPIRKDLYAQSDLHEATCAETAEGGSTPADGEETTTEEVVVMRIPLVPRDGNYAVTDADVQFWTQAYPRVDVLATLRRIASWMDANPTKRKTRRGIRRCIDSWLARDQDNGKTIRLNNHSSIGGLTFQ